jgi:branched-chain amino acid transport system ATP-binding protein
VSDQLALLETRGLTVTFGGLHANNNINLRVPKGGFVGLIGPNGAGKTTFIDAITGFVQPSAGEVFFDNQDLTALPAHERVARGLVRTFQSLELFEDLTVMDNLLVMAEPARWWSSLADIVRPGRKSGAVKRAEEALAILGISQTRDQLPTDLSHGQRKLVGVARSIAAGPKLLLLDEPAAGLDTNESQLLGRQLRGLLNSDITLFLIDHDMGLVLNVCTYLYVLDFGKVIAEGTPAQIRANPTVIAAYLGASAGEVQAAAGVAAGTPSLPDGGTDHA